MIRYLWHVIDDEGHKTEHWACWAATCKRTGMLELIDEQGRPVIGWAGGTWVKYEREIPPDDRPQRARKKT